MKQKHPQITLTQTILVVVNQAMLHYRLLDKNINVKLLAKKIPQLTCPTQMFVNVNEDSIT